MLAQALTEPLNLLGIGLGAATLNLGTPDNPAASTFSIGAAIWFLLSGIIASFVGGYVAGRLSGQPKETTAGWHGLTAWAATTLVIFFLLTSALGGLVGGAYRTVSSALGETTSAVGQTAQSAAQAAAPSLSRVTDPFGAIEQQIRGATGGNDPAAVRDAAVSAVRAALTGDQAQAQAARDRAAEALARAQNIPVEQARAQVQGYEQQYRRAADQAKQQATQAANTAAKGVSRTALFGSLGLILGAVAAWFGGRAGAVDPTITNRVLAYATGFVGNRGATPAGGTTTAGNKDRPAPPTSKGPGSS